MEPEHFYARAEHLWLMALRFVRVFAALWLVYFVGKAVWAAEAERYTYWGPGSFETEILSLFSLSVLIAWLWDLIDLAFKADLASDSANRETVRGDHECLEQSAASGDLRYVPTGRRFRNGGPVHIDLWETPRTLIMGPTPRNRLNVVFRAGQRLQQNPSPAAAPRSPDSIDR